VVGGSFTSIERGDCFVDDLKLLAGGNIIVAAKFDFDLVDERSQFVLGLFRPSLNALQQAFQIGCGHHTSMTRTGRRSNRYQAADQVPALPNASTCRPSRRRTIQNSSTVSNTSEIEVAAAAPWPPKRGTSMTQSATFMAKASA